MLKKETVYKGACAVIFLCLVSCVHLKAQNMMSEMNDLQNLAWYKAAFQSLEDSVVSYQEAMKQPQVPARRRAVLEEYSKSLQDYRQQLRQFVTAHRQEDTAAKALLISCFREVEVNADTLKALAGLLEGAGAHNTYAAYLAQELAGREHNQVGRDFLDFDMRNLQGEMVRSSDFRGKYLLVDFWASWCGPCRAEMPALLSVYRQYKDASFAVIAVSVDTEEQNWRKAVQQDGTDWLNVFDAKAWSSQVVRDYAIHRIPQNILIGPDGKIVARNISAAGLTKILSKATAGVKGS